MCESQDVMRWSIAHTQGTSNASLTGSHNHGSYYVRNHTNFASHCAPPPEPSVVLWYINGGFCLFWTLVLFALIHVMGQDMGFVESIVERFFAPLLLLTLWFGWLLRESDPYGAAIPCRDIPLVQAMGVRALP